MEGYLPPSPNYYSVIPAEVRYDDRLPAAAKLLYGEISSLANRDGYCFARNEYFSDLYRVTDRTITRLISKLAEYGYVTVRLIGNPADGQAFGRRIYIGAAAAALVDCNVTTTTKMSTPENFVGVTPTKMSTSTLINNNKTNKSTRAKKSTDLSAVKTELKQWVDGIGLQAQEADDLIARLSDFADMRVEKGNPMSAGRCISILVNRLQRYSGGNVAVMTAMLDNAIFRRWDSVYQLRDDELQEALGRSGSPGSNAAREEDCKWV